jgi:hypothetical protein
MLKKASLAVVLMSTFGLASMAHAALAIQKREIVNFSGTIGSCNLKKVNDGTLVQTRTGDEYIFTSRYDADVHDDVPDIAGVPGRIMVYANDKDVCAFSLALGDLRSTEGYDLSAVQGSIAAQFGQGAQTQDAIKPITWDGTPGDPKVIGAVLAKTEQGDEVIIDVAFSKNGVYAGGTYSADVTAVVYSL